jgi:purine-binding chemotaxis protein CheW
MDMEATIAEVQSATEVYNVVSFRLDQRIYTLPLQTVVQVMPMVTITPLPQSNKNLDGIINYRGRAVPVVNMRRYLGLPELRLGLYTPIMLVYINGRQVGLIVDDVIDVLLVSSDSIVRLKDILPEGFGESPLLQGLMHTPGGAMLLLDLEHLFSPLQVKALHQTLEALPERLVAGAGATPDVLVDALPEAPVVISAV